jgi:predicted phosphodiesterase
MRLVLISDTHNKHNEIFLPEGDVLIHCGDATSVGRQRECEKFLDWFASQPFKHKILIAGNHDWGFDPDNHKFEILASRRGWQPLVDKYSKRSVPLEKLAKHLQNYALQKGIIYLNDSSVVINGVKFFGSPRSKYFRGWAFNGEADKDHDWSNIDDDTDVLITHGPPWGILDLTQNSNESVGDKPLLARVYELKKLKVHAFGHIHECPGQRTFDGVTFINASTCNLRYEPRNPVQVFDLQ